ncbi:mycothiol synthase [Streptomyces sp. NBRC 109706]|uniref:mycothiol synthase n=1 Tax=Streptomyces sp. NBRC 109706 TaxID=1550035 RepID=UPI0007851F77|nr:mycothiol synthase [Streptomyces sp. NBRC 109706]
MTEVEVLDEVSGDELALVEGLIEAAARVDGQPAVSEQGRLLLRGGSREGVRHLLLRRGGELLGYAQLDGTDPVEPPSSELVVHPDHRGHRHGMLLGQALLTESGQRLRLWAHGAHPPARRLARRLGLAEFRELRQLRRPLTDLVLPDPTPAPGITVRAFVPGRDEAAWLRLNAAAFAHHPEQGSLTRRDLEARMAEPWFDPAGFFLAERDGELLGFHWTKVHAAEGLGEVYVLGVAPDAQGLGLGRALTTIGLRHLADDRGLATAMLYVDADNTAAVRVYESLGFTTYETDVMYRTET